MINKEKYAGTVSHGTMRSEDLIPAFIDTLMMIHDDLKLGNDECKEKANEINLSVQEIKMRLQNEVSKKDYFRSEMVDYDTEELFDLLNEVAPEGYYFGAHPGDGSDFGFWEYEDEI